MLELVRPVQATTVLTTVPRRGWRRRRRCRRRWCRRRRCRRRTRRRRTSASSDARASGLKKRWTISVASVPAPRRRQVSAWVGAGSMQSALLRATRGSQEMCGGATTSQRRVRRLGPAPRQPHGHNCAGTGESQAEAGTRGSRVLAEAAQPTYVHMQAPSQGSRWHMNRPASESRAHRKDWGGGSAGGQA